MAYGRWNMRQSLEKIQELTCKIDNRTDQMVWHHDDTGQTPKDLRKCLDEIYDILSPLTEAIIDSINMAEAFDKIWEYPPEPDQPTEENAYRTCKYCKKVFPKVENLNYSRVCADCQKKIDPEDSESLPDGMEQEI